LLFFLPGLLDRSRFSLHWRSNGRCGRCCSLFRCSADLGSCSSLLLSGLASLLSLLGSFLCLPLGFRLGCQTCFFSNPRLFSFALPLGFLRVGLAFYVGLLLAHFNVDGFATRHFKRAHCLALERNLARFGT